MVISEGWDIPRACLLYQVRDTKSKQLDEQVVGRVRRNPRLLDFDTLSPEAKDLAMTAWVWGVKPKNVRRTRQVKLWGRTPTDLQQNIMVKTTRLAEPTEKRGFDLEKLLEGKEKTTNQSIFDLWRKLEQCPPDVQKLCYDYAAGNAQRWWRFMENIGKICKEYNDCICDYDESIEVDKDVSFPVVSSYAETEHKKKINSWVWERKDGSGDSFTFDSEAERMWADVLKDCEEYMATAVNVTGEERSLWGKNFPVSSEIRYQYYLHGIHDSFPDFVMKDKHGRIHVFEVKSVNKSSLMMVDPEEYEEKVNALKDFYRHCSAKLDGHIFYLPVLDGDDWKIFRYKGGEGDSLTEKMFRDSLK